MKTNEEIVKGTRRTKKLHKKVIKTMGNKSKAVQDAKDSLDKFWEHARILTKCHGSNEYIKDENLFKFIK